MSAILLIALSILGNDVPSRLGDKQVTEFLLRLEATPWPKGINKQERIGRDEQGEIVALRMNGMELQASDFETLAKFPRLKSLTFADTNLADDDLKRLAALPALRGLVLDRTNITDAGLAHLAAVKDLRSLCLRTTRATPEGVKQLKEALPKLGVGFAP